MEDIHVQQKGSVNVIKHDFDLSLDNKFKPGLYLQVEEFISGTTDRLPTIEEHIENANNIYSIINK